MNNSYNVENGKGDIQQSWWKKRSSLEKRLSAFSAFALLIIVVLVIVIIIFFTRPSKTCLTPECVHITNELLEHMNTSVDPCEDFYEFTCGNFLDNIQLDGRPSVGVDTILYDTVNDRIRGIIEEPEYSDDPRSILLAKRLYRACNNQTVIDERSIRLIKNSLRQIGGWPTLDADWKEKDFDWLSATYKLRELGYNFEFFIVLKVVPDEVNPSQRIIEINKPYNELHYGTEEEEDWLHELMMDVAIAFGADRSRAKNDFRDVIDFEKSLLSLNNRNGNNTVDERYNPFTITELQYKFRGINWIEYINRLQFPASNITHDQIVSVSDEEYIRRLQQALKVKPKRVIANYVIWRILIEHVGYISSDIWESVKKYFTRMFKDEEIPPRPKICADIVDNTFATAIQAAYIRKHFSENAKLDVLDMLQNIKNEFREKLTHLDWIDEETRDKALERLAISNNYVAYPSDLMNIAKTEEPYMGFQVDDDFLSSVLNVNYYKTNLRFQRLHEPVEKDKELLAAYTTYTDSYYSSSSNTITVPAGFLQGVIYDYKRPQYLNYGALGSTLGHQIFHTTFEGTSFQAIDRYYDWITTQTRVNFNNKLSCVASHYVQYPVLEIGEHLNSSNTKYEDAADIAGVKLAYDAYKKWARHNGPERNLPGLDYTPKQLFWISSAIRFCKKSTPAALESIIAHHYRSPSKYRALGVLRNSKEFADDFNCPASSYMNHKDKCDIL